MGFRLFQPGCCCGGCVFMVDGTGSMGGHFTTLQALLNAIIDEFDMRTMVVEYEDVSSDPQIRQEFTSDATKLHAAVNGLVAGGGGDTDEDGGYCAYQLPNTYPGIKLIVWCGDAAFHETGTQGKSVGDVWEILNDKSIKVLFLNFAAEGQGLDGTAADGSQHQASTILDHITGQIFNSVNVGMEADILDAVETLIG